ncbi:hypothetical protein DFH07DRAFT_1014530 [Mycena maculata]|uniref:Ndc10 domain-containing protein n=1 Tax=Mycena maculata TaxID=230809 RepID=A0AAD7JJ74_9AGAR|nr:hypothetical protein DFH07DRAFT_1014530 [Mycena maculata]
MSAIDPVLLQESLPLSTNGGNAPILPRPPPRAQASRVPTTVQTNKQDLAAWAATNFAPKRAENEGQSSYELRLTHITRKEPLSEACSKLGIRVPKSANLSRLREELARYCVPLPHIGVPTGSSSLSHQVAASPSNPTEHSKKRSKQAKKKTAGPSRLHLLGYDAAVDDEEEDEEEDADWEDGAGVGNGSDTGGSDTSGSESEPEDSLQWTAEKKKAFRIQVRVDAVRRAEGNRRAGGLKTQNAMVRAWKEFVEIYLARGEIDDDIIDEISLLLYIEYCAERPKRTRKGVDIPGTFVGASHLKKLFFGALRIRKEQDAADPTLALQRPAVSVFVYDAIKCRMDEALERVRNGLVPNEDAPDIRANTWLSEVTDTQLERIGQGFLAHRHVRLSVFGHLSWTAQHASGNRGDDFRALKLAELQSHVLLHPDRRTAMESILGLQGEEKAGKRGMRTVINPVYTVFIPHLKPEMCPFGAFSFYFHYLHDEKKITESMNIDWTVNKSWRSIRVLHGPRSPVTPFNEQNMYNMYCRAYKDAGYTSRLKAHLPRHLLGYKQEALGVDAAETARLGWVRGETYMDTYAPALPKKAILAAAGYRDDEPYDPTWRHVPVPEQFLSLVCPNAESILERVEGEHIHSIN